MSAPALPCEHCRALVPRFEVSDPEFEAIVKALSEGSRTLAAAELKYFVQCTEPEAQAWVDHLLSCAHAWPRAEADQAVLRCIDEAFEGIPKPEHFTDRTHCSECKEHDDTLRNRTLRTLRREDLGSAGWDPLNFSSEKGIAYLFPALARFALLPDVWRERGWYGSQLIFHLSCDGGSNRFLAWCSNKQRDAVFALLSHLAATRPPAVERYADEEALLIALTAWQPPEASVHRTPDGAAEPDR
jgi:hypothetical protein